MGGWAQQPMENQRIKKKTGHEARFLIHSMKAAIITMAMNPNTISGG